MLLVSPGYPPDLFGGIEQSVRTLAQGLASAGHGVVVVAGTDQHQAGFRLSEEVDRQPESGVSVRVIRIHRSDLYFDHWQKIVSPRVGAAFDQIVRREKPDVVHVHHWLRLTRDLIQRAVLHGIPAVLTLHDFGSSCLIVHRLRPEDYSFCDLPSGSEECPACAQGVHMKTPWIDESRRAELLRRFVDETGRELRLASAILVLSEDQKRSLQRYLGPEVSELRVLSPPAMLQREESSEPPIELPRVLDGRHRLVLGTWGALHPLKGHDLIVDAMHLLLERGVDVELRIAGVETDLEFKRELKQRAGPLSVHFHGAYPAGSLERHPVTRVHAFVSASRARETWGLVVDEALALRLPLILPRTGAFRERFGMGRGVLFFRVGRARSLARVLFRLATHTGLLERLRARLPYPGEGQSSKETHVQQTVDLYRQVIKDGAADPATERPGKPAGRVERERRDMEFLKDWDAKCSRSPPDRSGRSG